MTTIERIESAFASIARSLTKISEVTSPTLPPGALPRGCMVRVAGTWSSFDGYDPEANLMYLDSGTAGWTITPGEGELFVWDRGPF